MKTVILKGIATAVDFKEVSEDEWPNGISFCAIGHSLRIALCIDGNLYSVTLADDELDRALHGLGDAISQLTLLQAPTVGSVQ